MHRAITALLGCLFLVSCTTTTKEPEKKKETLDGAPKYSVDVNFIPDAVPIVEPHSKYGNPKSYVVFGERYFVDKSAEGYKEIGIASWYGTKFHKRKTSSGEPYDMFKMTAAHKNLPIPTYAHVRNLQNDKSIIVKINDRGPFHEDRIIDLSYAAAKKLGISGTGKVEVIAIDPSDPSQMMASKDERQKELFLQIGAYTEKSRAELVVEKVKEITQHPTHILPIALAEKTIHRVHIGPFTNRKQSEEVNEALRDIGLSGAIVVTS